jgi:hypothetical protein
MDTTSNRLITPRNVLIAAFVFAATAGSVMTINVLRQRDANRADDAASFMSDEETTDWLTFADPDSGFSLKYPTGFFDPGAEPAVFVGDCNAAVFPKNCPNIDEIVVANEAPNDAAYAEAVRSNLEASTDWQRSERLATPSGAHYCLSTLTDAAMSHAYESRYYTTVRDQKCVVVKLTLSRTNCDVYLPLEEGNQVQKDGYDACVIKNAEQPKLIKQVFRTFKLGE